MNSTELSFVIKKEFEQSRIDIVLSNILEIPRNQIQIWIKDKRILANNKTIKKNFRVSENDYITVYIPVKNKININIENANVDIAYEDDSLIVINKPAGLVVHPGAGSEKKSVVGALLFRGIGLSNIGSPLRPGIVHRIDKDTSGLIVLAKNDKSHFILANQFFKHTIERKYIGIVEGHLNVMDGIIDKPIKRSITNRKRFSVSNTGKNAQTYFKVIKRLKDYDVILFKLKTGRTHQIRVHLKAINHPLVGDNTYGFKSKNPLIERQALHAFLLGFRHPKNDKYMCFVSKLPNDIKNIINMGD